MSLADNPRSPLPEWITDAYTALLDHITGSNTSDSQGQVLSISRREAIDVLFTADELAVESADAEYAITRLIERGYLYEVHSELRVTTPPDER